MVEWFKPRSDEQLGLFSFNFSVTLASKITKSRHLPVWILNVLGDLRFEYKFEIEYENDFSVLGFRLDVRELQHARFETRTATGSN